MSPKTPGPGSRIGPYAPFDLDALTRQQALALGGGTPGGRLTSPKSAEHFLSRVGLALRYQPTRGLPLASLRGAVGGPADTAALERSIALTNHLLANGRGIEVTVVADRLVLVDRSLMPALFRLVRRGRTPDDLAGLSPLAVTALAYITERREASVGDVRRHLGLPLRPRRDPAQEAVAELQRALLVDRGPFTPSKSAIPYLSRVGYPYHLFHVVHADLVREARSLAIEDARREWIAGYLRGATYAPTRTLLRLFRTFLSPAEIEAAVDDVAARKQIDVQGTGTARLCVWRT